ncbi:MAG TPA: PAS domain-containing protein, partial [Pseudoxanthomonas sp.]|nr:PAS domain-containing protein [Pseudoxanthomonas sp.]
MSASAAEKQPLAFLKDGGEMGERIRAYDWAVSPLGLPGLWPTQLKTAVRLMLTTRHPIFIFWGPQHIQLYNDAYSRSLGPERHPGALGQQGRECFDEIWDIIGPQIALVMEGRGATWHENHLVPTTRNGVREEVYWTYSYSPIDEPEAEHGVGGVLVLCSETTEHVLAERDNQLGRRRMEQMFQQAPGFMAMLHGPNHVFEMANPAYSELIGHREVLGKPLIEALPEAMSQGYVDILDEVYRSGKAYAATGARYEMAGIDGARPIERFVDFVFQPISDGDGKVTGIFVEGFDVSSAHSDAEAVRELYETMEQRVSDAVAERNLLANVMEFADAFILVVDLCYYVLAVNRAYADEFERIYGCRLKVGDHVVDMMQGDPARQERIRRHFDRAINGEDFHLSESYQSDEHGTRYYDARFNALRDRDGRQIGAFAIVYDITDRARAQARLAEAEERVRQTGKIEALGQLTGGVAHDFNNLLMVISGGLEVMDALAPARREKVVAGMHLAVEKGVGLSRQLLAFSRRQPLRPEPLDLARRIGGMREMLDRSLRGDVRVEVDFDPGLWAVEVDPDQLELVVLNLCVNARDAMAGGGIIRIHARNAPALNDEELFGDYVELAVIDSGTGMLPEVLARVFEPFFTTKEIGKGSGLGLAQAHGFAKASRGALRIESEPRSGTTVLLYLPRTDLLPVDAAEQL